MSWIGGIGCILVSQCQMGCVLAGRRKYGTGGVLCRVRGTRSKENGGKCEIA